MHAQRLVQQAPQQKTVSLSCTFADLRYRICRFGRTKTQIVVRLDLLVCEETQRLESLYQRKLAALDELKKSLLHQAFSGAL